jgi:hypothetical protein
MSENMKSDLEQLLPKPFHDTTARGFELKIARLILACNINNLVRYVMPQIKMLLYA